MSEFHKLDYESPIGVIEIIGTGDAIRSILFADRDKLENRLKEDTPEVLVDCLHQLDEYFKGVRNEFTIPYIFLDGTDFQKTVWNALTNIPYGETCSYQDIAVSIGNQKAVRAVGSANSKNKLSIVVPCHRVIGANGKLTGYAGGLWRKEWMLKHERSLKWKFEILLQKAK